MPTADAQLITSLILLLAAASGAVAQDTNGTADGGSNNGQGRCPGGIPGVTLLGPDCRLLCRTAQWTDVISFYVGNYVAHAATTVSSPGQSSLSSIIAIVTALVLPGGGVRSGVETIMSLAKFGRTNLRTAARAGALCAVVRVRTRKPEAEEAPEVTTEKEAQMRRLLGRCARGPPEGEAEAEAAPDDSLRVKKGQNPSFATKIHGLCRLPEGYDLMVVHPHATFNDDKAPPDLEGPWWKRSWNWTTDQVKHTFKPKPETTASVSCSYNAIKVIISVVQLALSISTLYRTRGDQLDRFGYAAFGLTVAPYAWMSLINLLANLACPQYNCMYVVRSEGLDDLEQRLREASEEDRGRFGVVGAVGCLDKDSDQYLQAYHRERLCIRLAVQEPADADVDLTSSEDKTLLRRYLYSRDETRQVWTQTQPAAEGQEKAEGGDAAAAAALHPLETTHLRAEMARASNVITYGFPVALVPIAIVGGISSFLPGRSTLEERVWTTMWLVLGVVGQALASPAVRLEGRPIIGGTATKKRKYLWLWYVYFVIAYGVTSVGGFVMVGKMISLFGVCQRLASGG